MFKNIIVALFVSEVAAVAHHLAHGLAIEGNLHRLGKLLHGQAIARGLAAAVPGCGRCQLLSLGGLPAEI